MGLEKKMEMAPTWAVFDIKLFQWYPDIQTMVMLYNTVEKLPHHFPISYIAVKGKYQTRQFVYDGKNTFGEFIYNETEESENSVLLLVQTAKSKIDTLRDASEGNWLGSRRAAAQRSTAQRSRY